MPHDTAMPDDMALTPLLNKLSLEQKVRLLTGADMWGLYDEPAIGLRRMVLSDGPSGIRGESFDGTETALNLPSATALGASWDTELAYRYGAVLAVEARRRGADVVLGPTINLHRSPLGGRHFEAFSEDPWLTSRLAGAYVRGIQDGGVGACPKHYVANDFETERFTADVAVSDRALRELYLAAFEDGVVEAGAWMVMAAYNAVNGTTMTEHGLLDEPLCGEWGFDGVIVSDWWAARSTEAAALGRLDLAMPGPDGPWGETLVEAVRAGRVPESEVDEKVHRLLRLAGRVGALEGVAPAVPSPPGSEDGVSLAREAAAAGMVLVRNSGELPWDGARLRKVAVIGHNAFVARTQGGGSALVEPEYTVSPVDGLRAALPGVEVTWCLGAAAQRALAPLPPGDLSDPVSGGPGVRVVFRAADGREIRNEWRRDCDLARLGSPRLREAAEVELSMRLCPRESGAVRLGVAAAGRVTMRVDGAEVLDEVLVHEGRVFGGGLVSPPLASVPLVLTAGEEVDLRVRLEPAQGLPEDAASLIVGFDLEIMSPAEHVDEAVAAARNADAVVVVVGTSPDVESESFDRADLALPGRQDELVHAVAAANPRTVAVVNAGAPVTMPWREEVAGVLLTWFGGQEYGNALADVLLGVAEPGGRLPTTWPGEEADVPILDTAPVDGVVRYSEDVHIGYRAWLRAGSIPAYPFGYGLGYTTWALSGLELRGEIHATEPDARGGISVDVRARNTGDRAGRHVVQAYLSKQDSVVDRPEMWLAGFATVHAEAGDAAMVRMEIPARAFAHWADGWRIEAGTYTLHVGSHVADLPLTVDVEAG